MISPFSRQFHTFLLVLSAFPALASGCAYFRATRVVGKLVSFFKTGQSASEILGRRISELRWVARKQAHRILLAASSRPPSPPV